MKPPSPRKCKCNRASGQPSRRDFLRVGTTATALAVTPSVKAKVGDFPPEAKVPPGKSWWDALFERGGPIRYAGASLQKVAMPLGGIGTGSVALHGTGRLVQWQIFNMIDKRCQVDDSFFAIRTETGKRVVARVLQEGDLGDLPGVESVEFVGEYPLAQIRFTDKKLPVEVRLEALNPMIPLNEKDSALPCAIFLYTVKNPGRESVRVQFLATLQNAVGHSGHSAANGPRLDAYGFNTNELIGDGEPAVIRMGAVGCDPPKAKPGFNVVADHEMVWADRRWPVEGVTFTSVSATVKKCVEGKHAGADRRCWWLTGQGPASLSVANQRAIAEDVKAGATLIVSGASHPWLRSIVDSRQVAETERVEEVFAEFEGKDYGDWTPAGRAFGKAPARGRFPGQQPVSGYRGKGLVNTFNPDDNTTGTLTSPEFTVKLPYITYRIGGGKHAGRCCLNLLIDGKVVLSDTGLNDERLVPKHWDVRKYQGKRAALQIVDSQVGPWGHVNVDDIRFSNMLPDTWPRDHAKLMASLLPVELGGYPVARPAAEVMLPGSEASRRLLVTGHLPGMRPRTGAEVLVKTDDGRPLMVAHHCGQGRVILLLGDLVRGSERPGPHDRNELLAFVAHQLGSKLDVSKGVPTSLDSYGTMCLATPRKEAVHRTDWSRRSQFWTHFASAGDLDGKADPTPPSAPGRTWNAATAIGLELRPGEEATLPFVISWHFPNHYWGAANIGNRYAATFADAAAVARYVVANLDRLVAETRLYRDALYDSTLPVYLIDAFGSQASIVRSQTCMWAKDGTFAAFEGCGRTSGCCPMNCNHVWNYEQSLAKLWPGIERDMRVTELDYHQHDHGGTCHRVTIPRPEKVRGAGPVADGQCGAVLKAYREYLQSADETFTKQRWGKVKKAMDYAITTWDPDGDGVMETPQFNTYDRVIYGHNTFVTSLYLAALRAAEELATAFGDAASAKRYRGLFEKGKAKCAAELFNGEYYIQKAANLNLGYGTGVWADQVVGQWWAKVLDLGEILPTDQVRSALTAIFRYNWLWTQEGFQGTQRYKQFADGKDKGLLCGSWPKGGRPKDPILYRDEAWTGVEYQVAAHKIWEGQFREALAMVKGVRERYNGVKRNPFNEIECGDHYARAMSSWSMLLAAQGYRYHGPTGRIGFDPRLDPDDHKSFFTSAEGWGSFSQKRTGRAQQNELHVRYGRLRLRTLSLGVPNGAKAAKATVKLDGQAVQGKASVADGTMTVAFDEITIEKGQVLSVTLGWG